MRGMIDFIEPFEARDRTTGELLSLIVEKHVGNVPPPPDLTRMTTKEMAKCLGIDGKGAQKIQAALELSSRSRPLTRSLPLRNVEDVVLYFRERLGDHRKESFWALTLDRKHHPIDCHRISEGTLTMCPVHPREAFLPALRDSAAAVIFVHNHTSGNHEPSDPDRRLTKRLSKCGNLLGIRVLDHLVVGSEGHYSFRDHGAIENEGESRAAEAGRQKPAVSTRNEPGRTGGEGVDRRPEPRPSAAMEKPPQQIRDRFRDDGRGR